jgi:hypothetical protein
VGVLRAHHLGAGLAIKKSTQKNPPKKPKKPPKKTTKNVLFFIFINF